MRYHIGAMLLAAGIAGVRPAVAQNPECAGYGGQAANVCNAAVDGTRLFYPVAGLLLGGGQPLLGPAAGRGGFPRAGLVLRVNAASVQLPSLDYDGSTSTVAAGDELVVPAPLVEGEIGLWDGLGGGLLRLSFLGSVQLLPTDQVDDLTVDPDAASLGDVALGLGYGARIGVLDPAFPVPGIGVSVMRRSIPDLRYGDLADPGQDYEYVAGLAALNVRASAEWRVAAFGFGGGLGLDRYTGDATVRFRDPILGLPQAAVDIRVEESRWLAFLDATVGFGPARLGAEIGWQLAKDQDLATEFEEVDEDGGRFFGGLAVGLAF